MLGIMALLPRAVGCWPGRPRHRKKSNFSHIISIGFSARLRNLLVVGMIRIRYWRDRVPYRVNYLIENNAPLRRNDLQTYLPADLYTAEKRSICAQLNDYCADFYC